MVSCLSIELMTSWWKSLNTDQRALVSHPSVIPRDYFNATWSDIVRATVFATLICFLMRLARIDPILRSLEANNALYKYLQGLSIRLLAYPSLVAALAILISLLCFPYLIRLLRRMALSWVYGIWRAAPIGLFTAVVIELSRNHFNTRRMITAAAIIVFVDHFPFYVAQLRKLRTLKPAEILNSHPSALKLLRRRRSLDDPIFEWSQDLLNRSALVESLKVKLLVGEAPVIALRGGFGDGKSSVLNLLLDDLRGHAIVVSFSTWLPGSEATLTTELLRDVSKECHRHYYLPGLRQAFIKYSKVFSVDVPYFRGLREIFQPPTQREELNDLRTILEELPKRIIVLLDEIDRMRRKELLTLLKLIRGMGAIPNLSFVCAFDREQVERTVCHSFDDSSHEYFEKFFPTAVDLPEIVGTLLMNEFIETLTSSIFAQGWS